MFQTELRTDVSAHEKVRLFGIVIVGGGKAALTEFEAPPMGVVFDESRDCEGNAAVAIEGYLEPTGEAMLNPMFIGPVKSPYRLEHAKVSGSANAVCKPNGNLPIGRNPFDRAAAAAALGAGAQALGDCNLHRPGEVGHAKITFSPNGHVLIESSLVSFEVN